MVIKLRYRDNEESRGNADVELKVAKNRYCSRFQRLADTVSESAIDAGFHGYASINQ